MASALPNGTCYGMTMATVRLKRTVDQGMSSRTGLTKNREHGMRHFGKTHRHVMAAAALALIVPACGGGEAAGGGSDTDETTTAETATDGDGAETTTSEAAADDGGGEATGEVIRAALPHHMAADSTDDQCINDFADRANQATNGQITFDITPGGALGGEADVEQNLFEGVFESTLMSSVLMGVWYEPAQVLTLPYVFTDLESAREVLNSDVMAPVFDGLREEKGARLLGWCHFSLRNIAANNPIRTPADLSGVKIRVPETPSFVQTFEALGANPTPLPYPEVYTNLQTGVVDAVDSSFSAMYDTNIHEVAKTFSETKHIFTSQGIVVNEEWFQGLSDDHQAALTEAAQAAEEAHFDKFLDGEAEVVPQLEEAGVDVVTDVDLDAMEEAVSGARDSLAAQYGVEDLLTEIQAALGN